MKHILLTAAAGKTIARVVCDEDFPREVAIVFDDGTYATVAANSDDPPTLEFDWTAEECRISLDAGGKAG